MNKLIALSMLVASCASQQVPQLPNYNVPVEITHVGPNVKYNDPNMMQAVNQFITNIPLTEISANQQIKVGLPTFIRGKGAANFDAAAKKYTQDLLDAQKQHTEDKIQAMKKKLTNGGYQQIDEKRTKRNVVHQLNALPKFDFGDYKLAFFVDDVMA